MDWSTIGSMVQATVLVVGVMVAVSIIRDLIEQNKGE